MGLTEEWVEGGKKSVTGDATQKLPNLYTDEQNIKLYTVRKSMAVLKKS